MNQKKIKVVWICHFTNAEMQSFLPLWRKQDEFAPWIPNLLNGFENREDIEIHVISPHNYLKRSTNLTIRNIHYHFIHYGMPFRHRHWPGIFTFDIYTNYYFFRKRVKNVINHVQPDLINLIGAENSYYSSSILDFKKDYPVLILIQGFISQMRGATKLTTVVKKRMNVEEKILTKFKYYGGEQDSSGYISGYNAHHVFFRLYFPVNECLASGTRDVEKKYDCIYFGRLERIKGAEDFIRVVAEMKEKKTDIKACMVGGGDVNALIALANELNCTANIEFTGFVTTQKELFEYVKASRVFLAPPYFERLSSTIREAMFLKVPVVAYATGGIPYINEFDEHIYLVETGNYKEMARKTLLLLGDDQSRDQLAEKAFKYGINEYGLTVNCERILSAYHTILNEAKQS
jgi:glycosyltransferase involved in cell wall biosynthesis